VALGCVPSKVLALRATEDPQRGVLSHGLGGWLHGDLAVAQSRAVSGVLAKRR